jgi:glycine betaine catabolism A
MSGAHRTLPGTDYHSPEVYQADLERIFFKSWLYAGRVEQVDEPGKWFTVEIAGESIIVVGDKNGGINAFYNVCRHRGSRICDGEAGRTKSFLRCPYHAWGYGTDGSLRVTPYIEDGEIDKEAYGLHPVYADTWQGFVFINLDKDSPMPLREFLGKNYDEPLRFERFDMGALKIAVTTVTDVACNWKTYIENYNECLHCPGVHPELGAAVPVYKDGVAWEDREDLGVTRADGKVGYVPDGVESGIAPLPTMTADEATSVYGATLFPNAFLDIAGNVVIGSRIIPTGPTTIQITTQYLFHPDAMAADDFDPKPTVDFSELVAAQDYLVSERSQLGMQSRAYDHGIYPEKDIYVHWFNERYRAERGEL